MSASNANERLGRALNCLEGLSVGDAFGAFFEFASPLSARARKRILPKPTWRYTDDTAMALSLFAILRQYGEVNQEQVAGVPSQAQEVAGGRWQVAGAMASCTRATTKMGTWLRRDIVRSWSSVTPFGDGNAKKRSK